MSTATCCLPSPGAQRLPTRSSLPERAGEAWRTGLEWLIRRLAGLREQHRAWGQERRRRASLRGLSAHTLRDIGLGDYAPSEPPRPDLEWDAGRWQ
jgi:uncharacterized protein YjiS (DUF1127 family)